MKSLLIATAIIEGLTGLALAFAPSFVASILLGSSLTDPSAILVARLAGAALITIAIACWLSGNENHPATMVKAMIGYNIFSITLLVYAALFEKISGQGLWPAVLLHLGLLIWCLYSLWKKAR